MAMTAMARAAYVAAILAGTIVAGCQTDAQILAALAARQHSAEAIVARVYAELPPALRPAAVETVLAHLVKLEREGLVRRVADEWSQVG